MRHSPDRRQVYDRLIAIFVIAVSSADFTHAAESFAVFKSTDRGRSWIPADSGLPNNSRINAFGSLDEIVFAGTDSGMFFSTDAARTWQPIVGVADRILSFGTFGKVIFAGTNGNGLLVSDSQGRSWRSSASFPGKKVRSLLAKGTQVFAGTDAEGVFVSVNGGRTWRSLERGFPANAQVFALSAVEGSLFAGLYSKGLWTWDELQRRWIKLEPLLPLALAAAGGALVAGHNPGGLHWSTDLGRSWAKGIAAPAGNFATPYIDDARELSPEAPVWELASDSKIVFAGASAGIYYSEDSGHTWLRPRTGLPAASPGISFLVHQSFVLATVQTSGARLR